VELCADTLLISDCVLAGRLMSFEDESERNELDLDVVLDALVAVEAADPARELLRESMYYQTNNTAVGGRPNTAKRILNFGVSGFGGNSPITKSGNFSDNSRSPLITC
jgi:hypothetical protein